MFQQAQRFETLLVKHVYYYAMPTVIVRQVEVFRLQVLFVRFCGAVVCKVFNCWICQKPWVEEDGAEEEVVVRFGQPEVEVCFEIKSHFKEAFNAWKVSVDHAR